MVQGDFPIKYGPKTQKYPWSISQKTLGHFEITFKKKNTIGNPYLTYSNTDQKAPKKF